MDGDLAVWALWARPRGDEEGGRGGITSYGRDGTSLDAVENVTIDEVWRLFFQLGGGSISGTTVVDPTEGAP